MQAQPLGVPVPACAVIKKGLAVLIAGQVGFEVEMSGPPVPSLRYDAGPAEPDPGIGIDARK